MAIDDTATATVTVTVNIDDRIWIQQFCHESAHHVSDENFMSREREKAMAVDTAELQPLN
jgi:hypothetical protein